MVRFLLLVALSISATSLAADSAHQPYKGFIARDIASLSDEDIRQLQSGAGWGLALPAELNGHPGPLHVLELVEELALSEDQVTRVTQLYDEMRAEAVVAGRALVAAERALDMGFSAGGLVAGELRRLVQSAEEARAELRYIHLSRHLATVEILSRHQIATYSVLRGYGDDPCVTVPDGHDPAMWRRHNGCAED